MSYEPLVTEFLGVTLKNPVLAASGTVGFGREYETLASLSKLGGICSKGLTLNGSLGNDGPRIYETPAGLLNSIGLENPGVERFIKEELPFMRSLGCAVIANLGGHSETEYIKGASLLNDAEIDILELNISCPNILDGGMAFGIDPKSAADITKKVKAESCHPLLVKLTPNAPDLIAVAAACEEAGADGLSLVNTFLGMAIDTKLRKPVFNNVYAGLSGPAVFPIALRMVHEVCKAVSIPVAGIGGIATREDALSFLMAGASVVQVGSMTFAAPDTMANLVDELYDYCKLNALENIRQIVGIL